MKAQRGRSALLRSTALLIVGALALPQAAVAAGSRHHREAALQGGTMLPEPSDIGPGDDARASLSRLVAEPGSVLDAYAPTRGGGSLSADAPSRALAAATGDALPTGSVAGTGGAVAAPVPPAAVPVASPPGPDPLAYAPASADTPLLDAATLQHALEAWVGPEPQRAS